MKKLGLGFTLIELMITIVIAAILMGMGVPSFLEMIRSNNIAGQANDFITGLNLARSEAIRRGAPVCVVRISATDNVWTKGWQIFVDGITTRTFASEADRCNTTGVIIQKYPELTGGSTLISDDSFKFAVRFNSMGVAVNKDDVGISGNLKLCRQDNNNSKSKLLNISITGAISVSATAPTCS